MGEFIVRSFRSAKLCTMRIVSGPLLSKVPAIKSSAFPNPFSTHSVTVSSFGGFKM